MDDILPEIERREYRAIMAQIREHWPQFEAEWPPTYEAWLERIGRDQKARAQKDHAPRFVDVFASDFLAFCTERRSAGFQELLRFAYEEAARQDVMPESDPDDPFGHSID